jgi:hypothetical protein
MALSDCHKCWDTPCSCGYDYKDYTPEQLAAHIARICQYRSKDEALKILSSAVDKVADDENWNKNIKGEELKDG